MKLIVSRRATLRIREIAAYVKEYNPPAARAIRDAIRDAFELLKVYPEAGRAVERGVRRFVVPRFPYIIYYRVSEAASVVQIITVNHAAQERENEA